MIVCSTPVSLLVSAFSSRYNLFYQQRFNYVRISAKAQQEALVNSLLETQSKQSSQIESLKADLSAAQKETDVWLNKHTSIVAGTLTHTELFYALFYSFSLSLIRFSFFFTLSVISYLENQTWMKKRKRFKS
jgi:hypothetical protein